MADRWVLNTSPLIVRGKIGRIALLDGLADEVAVPPSVKAEVQRAGDAASRALSEARSFRFLDAVEPDPTVAAWGLGRGESEVITFASRHRGYEAILDDLAARRCAAALEIRTRGTLGIVLLAKQRALIPSAASVIDELRLAGLYLSSALAAEALALVGESGEDGRPRG